MHVSTESLIVIMLVAIIAAWLAGQIAIVGKGRET